MNIYDKLAKQITDRHVAAMRDDMRKATDRQIAAMRAAMDKIDAKHRR